MATEHGLLFDPELACHTVLKIQNKCSKSKARASLPDLLTIKKVDERNGVFAKCSFTQVTQFGPLEAPMVKKSEVIDTKFLLKLDIMKCRRLKNVDASFIYFDISNENMCNWLMYIEPARSFSEQNLCAHQEEDYIYYTTCRNIEPDEELKVWYSPSYAKFLSVSVLTPTSGTVDVPKFNHTSIAGRKAKTSMRMQVYLDASVSERDVRSIPPKKRGWKRSTREKRPFVSSETSLLMSYIEPKRRIRKKLPKGAKLHECFECHKTFKSQYKLRMHSVIHSNMRQFLCHLCGTTFKRKDKLHDHVVNLHNALPKKKKIIKAVNLDQYPFKCTHCVIGFQRRGMFINHLIKRHPGVQTSSFTELNYPILKTVRDYLCPYCDKVYKSSSKRKHHVANKHPGCDPPPSIRKIKKNPQDNEASSTIVSKDCIAVRPECCQYCTRQYSTKHKLTKHIKEKHPEVLKPSKPAVQSLQPAATPNYVSGTLVPMGTTVTLPFKKGYQHQESIMPLYQESSEELGTNTNDLLTQAMTALQPPITPISEDQNFSHNFQEPIPKLDGYAGSRKYMLLKSYDDSLNSSQVQRNKATGYSQGKQMPYKNRLLNNEHQWKHVQIEPTVISKPMHSSTIVEMHTGTLSPTYEPLHNNHHSLDTMLGPDTTNEISLLSSGTTEPHILNDQQKSHHILQPVYSSENHSLDPSELTNVYAHTGTGNWIYQ